MTTGAEVHVPGVGTTVVGVDGSTDSFDAVRWAVQDAELHEGDVLLINATGRNSPSTGPPPQAPLDGARLLSEALAVSTRGSSTPGAVSVATSLVDDTPAQALLDMSETARLLVVGAHGVHGSGHTMLGSTTEAVASHGRCPVAVVQYLDHGSAAPGHRPVVVGTDLSAGGLRALVVAADEAHRRAAALTVVHAWSDTDLTVGVHVPSPAREGDRGRADRLLVEHLADIVARYPDVAVRRVVVRDRPAQAILDHGQGAQLVVVGSRGRGGFRGMSLGSTGRAVLHRAQCPVIVVRDSEG